MWTITPQETAVRCMWRRPDSGHWSLPFPWPSDMPDKGQSGLSAHCFSCPGSHLKTCSDGQTQTLRCIQWVRPVLLKGTSRSVLKAIHYWGEREGERAAMTQWGEGDESCEVCSARTTAQQLLYQLIHLKIGSGYAGDVTAALPMKCFDIWVFISQANWGGRKRRAEWRDALISWIYDFLHQTDYQILKWRSPN